MDFLWSLKEMRTPFFDTFFSLITQLGEEMILIAIFSILFWCVNKRMAYVLGSSFFISSLIVQGAKPLFRVPRPWVYDPTFAPVGSSIDPATGLATGGSVGTATGYAFPSGHTQNGTALFGSLGAQIKNKIVKVVAFTLVALIAFSRLYLGVHYISDVVVALIISVGAILFALKFITEESESLKRELLVPGIIALLAIAAIIVVAVLYIGEVTTYAQLRDTIIPAGAGLGFAIGMFVERNYIKFSTKAQNLPIQFLKLVLGFAVVMGILEGGRIFGANLFGDGLRYFLAVIWLTIVFPLIIKKFFTKK